MEEGRGSPGGRPGPIHAVGEQGSCSFFCLPQVATCLLGAGYSWHRDLSAQLRLDTQQGRVPPPGTCSQETFWAPSECHPMLGPGEARCAWQVLLDFKRGLTVQSVVSSWICLFMAMLFLCCGTRVSLTEARSNYSLLLCSLLWCMGFLFWWLLLLWLAGSGMWALFVPWNVGS